MTTYTTASTAQPAFTMADLERMVRVVRSFPPEPIGEWMREKGYPPEQWHVVMPKHVQDAGDGPMVWPAYVTFSPYIDKPVFVAKTKKPVEWAQYDSEDDLK